MASRAAYIFSGASMPSTERPLREGSLGEVAQRESLVAQGAFGREDGQAS